MSEWLPNNNVMHIFVSLIITYEWYA